MTGPDREALDWAVRTADPDFIDWEAFTVWLEASPGHSDRYDAAVAAIARSAGIASALPPTPPPANDGWSGPVAAAPARRVALRWIGGALAAALVATVGTTLWERRAQPYEVATAAGRQQVVRLDDGSEIAIAGGSRVRLDRADPRIAVVDAGAALFRVQHDESRPFTVRAAGVEMVDQGTVFDVSHDAGVTRVAVSEGLVVVDPADAAVRLAPGQAVRIEANRIERQTVVPGDVGGWRAGRLSFDDASLAEVAAALTRALPQPVTATPAISLLRFRGTITVERIADDPILLGRLLGVAVRTGSGGGWTLEAPR